MMLESHPHLGDVFRPVSNRLIRLAVIDRLRILRVPA